MFGENEHAAAQASSTDGNFLQIGKADARIRTADPFITSEVLYQLSYVGAGPEV